MTFIQTHLLTLLVLLPFAGALLAATFPRGEHTGVRGLGLFITGLTCAVALCVWQRFDPTNGALQLREQSLWLPSLGVHWALAVDGVAMPLVLLTTVMAPIALLASCSHISERTRDLVVCLLALEGAVLGGFVAIDLFAFYVFWEGMLVPSFFLIGAWGGPGRHQAALKFFLYTMAGSMLLLVALLTLVHATALGQTPTFLWPELMARVNERGLGMLEFWLFLGFALAFIIKIPLVPLHAWLPETYAESPVATVIMLSAVMVKLGAFGLLRYALMLFPRAATVCLPTLAVLSVVSILYGAWLAASQLSLRRVVAYSSVSHMGFVALGLCTMAPVALSGSVLQMVNHGVSTGALFILCGAIKERAGHDCLPKLGGFAGPYPKLAFVFMLMALSSMGLPGLNGFVGEFLILVGTFANQGLAVSVSEGVVAQAGWLVLTGLGLTAFLALVWRLVPQRGEGPQVSLSLRVGALFAVATILLALVAPPLGGFSAGLLVSPLAQRALSAEPFVGLYPTLASLATLGVVLAAIYLLRAVGQVLFGQFQAPPDSIHRPLDLGAREWAMLLPLLLLAVGLGLYPTSLSSVSEATVKAYVAQFRLAAGWPEALPLSSGPTEPTGTSKDLSR